jgi:hypothetical protein
MKEAANGGDLGLGRGGVDMGFDASKMLPLPNAEADTFIAHEDVRPRHHGANLLRGLAAKRAVTCRLLGSGSIDHGCIVPIERRSKQMM